MAKNSSACRSIDRSPWFQALLFPFLVLSFFSISGSQSSALAADPSQDWLAPASFPIATGPADQTSPAVEGDIVIYKEVQGTIRNLYGINLAGSAGAQLLTNDLSRLLRNLDIKSSRAIYQENGYWRFCSQDLAVEPWNQATANCVAANTGTDISATSDGRGVYYSGSSGLSGSGGIYFLDFRTGVHTTIDPNMYTSSPYVTDTGAIWTRSIGWQGRYSSNVIVSGSQYLSGPGCQMNTNRDIARVAGSSIIYNRWINPGDYDVVTYVGNPDSVDEAIRCAEADVAAGPGDQKNAEITTYHDDKGQAHDLIVWEDSRNGNFDIYMKDLATSQEVAISQEYDHPQHPATPLASHGRPFLFS